MQRYNYNLKITGTDIIAKQKFKKKISSTNYFYLYLNQWIRYVIFSLEVMSSNIRMINNSFEQVKNGTHYLQNSCKHEQQPAYSENVTLQSNVNYFTRISH